MVERGLVSSSARFLSTLGWILFHPIDFWASKWISRSLNPKVLHLMSSSSSRQERIHWSFCIAGRCLHRLQPFMNRNKVSRVKRLIKISYATSKKFPGRSFLLPWERMLSYGLGLCLALKTPSLVVMVVFITRYKTPRDKCPISTDIHELLPWGSPKTWPKLALQAPAESNLSALTYPAFILGWDPNKKMPGCLHHL